MRKELLDAGYDCMYTEYTLGTHREYGFSDSPTNPKWNDFTRLREWMFKQKKITDAWPIISSPTCAVGDLGKPFTYTITASNTPAIFAAEDLPEGLTLNDNTGVISGTPREDGTSFITLKATNAKGTGITMLTLTVKSDRPATGPMSRPAATVEK